MYNEDLNNLSTEENVSDTNTVIKEEEARKILIKIFDEYKYKITFKQVTNDGKYIFEISNKENAVYEIKGDELIKKKEFNDKLSIRLEDAILTKLATLSEKFSLCLETLRKDAEAYHSTWDNLKKAKYCEHVLLQDMAKLRETADAMELIIGKEFHPYPNYEDILYSVKY